MNKHRVMDNYLATGIDDGYEVDDLHQYLPKG